MKELATWTAVLPGEDALGLFSNASPNYDMVTSLSCSFVYVPLGKHVQMWVLSAYEQMLEKGEQCHSHINECGLQLVGIVVW